jgi:hypothetical protein
MQPDPFAPWGAKFTQNTGGIGQANSLESRFSLNKVRLGI